LIVLAPGGLGNQLFALAAALHISEKRRITVHVLSDNKELVAKVLEVKKNLKNPTKVRVNYSRKFNLWTNKTSSRMLILSSKVPRVDSYMIRKFRTMSHSWEFPFDLLDISAKKPWILRGFFQDIKLVQELSESNRVFLARLFDIELAQEYPGKILYPKSIGVHIRRGDYKDIPSYGILAIPYFQQLISQSSFNQLPTYVASDDSNLLAINRFTSRDTILDPKIKSPLTTMMILARVDIFLMSNSTFSFWIGWIVCLRGGRVYMPNPWFKHVEVPEDFLFMESFIRTNAQFE